MKINHINFSFRIIVSLILWFQECSEAAVRMCFTKEIFFKMLQNLQKKNVCRSLFLIKLSLQLFFEIIKSNFFIKHSYEKVHSQGPFHGM